MKTGKAVSKVTAGDVVPSSIMEATPNSADSRARYLVRLQTIEMLEKPHTKNTS